MDTAGKISSATLHLIFFLFFFSIDKNELFNNLFYTLFNTLPCLFQLFCFSPRYKSFFSMPLQELPLVALQSQEKIAFIVSGLPQLSGAGICPNLEDYAQK
jgi:hypothetical protein